MKKILLLLALLFNTAIAQDKLTYWAQATVEGMHCTIDINGIEIFDSIDTYDGKLQTAISFGNDYGNLMIAGDNEIGITVWATDERLEGVTPTCQITITEHKHNPETGQNESQEVTMLKVIEDQPGHYTAMQSTRYPNSSRTAAPEMQILSTQYQANAQNNKDLRFTRLLNVPYNLPFRWKDAAIFKDTPENRARLWAKYEKLQTIFKNKDYQALVASSKEAIEDRAAYEQESFTDVANYWKYKIESTFNNPHFKVLPYNKDDYRLLVMGNGRLVQFVSKDHQYRSPVQYKLGAESDNIGWSNQFYALVSGQLVPVIW